MYVEVRQDCSRLLLPQKTAGLVSIQAYNWLGVHTPSKSCICNLVTIFSLVQSFLTLVVKGLLDRWCLFSNWWKEWLIYRYHRVFHTFTCLELFTWMWNQQIYLLWNVKWREKSAISWVILEWQLAWMARVTMNKAQLGNTHNKEQGPSCCEEGSLQLLSKLCMHLV